ncbi:unnamed protein product [Rotaria magnacalcarata]|uniref:Uncharacterized protein n=1 Tax=Rotaria magnacalcarata TaxID=392030 RepID=A0A8S3HYA2_9BILA|nr:unnamed protein product [Rotaria magnacalcarata]
MLRKLCDTENESSNCIAFILAPLEVSQPLSDIHVLLGQPGTLTLTCDGFPVPKVTWYVLQRHRIEKYYKA